MSGVSMNFTRREFLQKGTLTAIAAGFISNSRGESTKKDQKVGTKKILNYNSEMRYRQLGNTDIYLSAISFGGLVAEESVFHYGIDRGVNLMHMAQGYKDGRSIETLGRVMKTKRDKVYIALKANFDDFDECLKILNTDHVDFIMFDRHSKSGVNNPKDFETFEKYKQQGKVRFPGLTTHKEVKACVAKGVDGGKYSLIMPVLNQPAFESMNRELQKAYEKGIGIMAMKTMKGIKNKPDLEIAYLKKVLQNPAITTVNKGIGSFEKFDAYLKATQEVLTSAEDFSLYKYAQMNRSNNCMMCSECERACPQNIEISTMLRCKDYYYEQLGDLQTAVDTYESIPKENRILTSCSICKRCEIECPNSINIVELLKAAQRIFEPLV